MLVTECPTNGDLDGGDEEKCPMAEQTENECCFDGPRVFSEARHAEKITGLEEEDGQNWRTKERMKTVSVAIVLCLNVGVDPPDIVKPNPCAVLQCWTDPFAQQPARAAETIANNLAKQYERLQPRARFKHNIDPTIEDVKKLCTTVRRSSKEERVLFHYNGHGVPKPTINGEIWVFNRNFTQYIPLSLYDLQSWMGTPSLYVFDCSNAGAVVDLFHQFSAQHQKEYELNSQSAFVASEMNQHSKSFSPPNYHNTILLGACDKNETLPLHPDVPADLFTSCLTTPIKTFLLWFLKQKSCKLSANCSEELIEKIPGSHNDRKSVLGELHWIFTAITDTIAWNTLPRDQFQRLFRQDSLVASLFRNFLLAQRIMRSYDCRPISFPEIRSVHHHPMWDSWDLAVDHVLSQMITSQQTRIPPTFLPSLFFTEQLTAFQVWLKLSAEVVSPDRPPTPEQLPIILQVLLSQVHRSRALDLLGSFLNLGPWAVNQALSVGIFPYVLKLLQASARELKPFLVFIWAKILAIDESSQIELVRENAHRYFINMLSDQNISLNHQVMSAFVLSVMVRRNPAGQKAVMQSCGTSGSIIDTALLLLMDSQHSNLRKWLVICLGNVWENNEENRGVATRGAVYERLYELLDDPVPEVRTAVVYALGTFINSISDRNEHAIDVDRNIVSTLLHKIAYDSSPLVRQELLVTLHWFILIFEQNFLPFFCNRAFVEQNSNNSPQNSLNNYSNFLTDSWNSNDNYNMSNTRRPSHRLPSERSHSKLLTVPELPLHAKTNHVRQQSTPPSMNHLRRVSSHSSLSGAMTSQSITSIFARVWKVIELYKLDPYPLVSQMASTIYNEVKTKSFRVMKDNLSDDSNSGPPSPQNRTQYLSTPLTPGGEYGKSLSTSQNVKHHSGRVSISAITSPYIPHSNNYNEFFNSTLTPFSAKRHIFGREPGTLENGGGGPRNGSEGYQVCRKPLVNTEFVDWCTRQFTQPCAHAGLCCCNNTELSQQDYASEWRQGLLKEHYAKARRVLNEKYLSQVPTVSQVEESVTKVEHDAFYLAFHPFDKWLATAGRETISGWNYAYPEEPMQKCPGEAKAGISDMHLINTHYKPLVLAAAEDGSVQVWSDLFSNTFEAPASEGGKKRESYLATAFFIFDDMPFRKATNAKRVVLTWSQYKHRLAAGGDHKYLRLWDALLEKKVRDIETGAEVVTSITSDHYNMVCIGCEDGIVRIFDEREFAKQGRVLSFSGDVSPVVNAQLWSQGVPQVICGRQNGHLCWYDQRHPGKAVNEEELQDPLTAMTFHSNTDLFACASGGLLSGCKVQVYSLNSAMGTKGPTLYFLNQSIRQLTFHPLKHKMAVATSDSIVAIYKLPMRSSVEYNLNPQEDYCYEAGITEEV